MDKSIELLKKYCQHDNIKLTNRGNTAIFAALKLAKETNPGKNTVIIPDQGGWLSYEKYAKKLGFNLIKIETDLGVIDPDNIKDILDSSNGSDVNCLLYENPAGYYANQPIKEIYEVCLRRCTVIMDVTGCIGDTFLCNGDYADIMVGSFGKWKIVWAEYGGFISTKQIDLNSLELEFNSDKLEIITNALVAALERIEKLYLICNKIKNELSNHKILHLKLKGVCVIVSFETEAEKNNILEYLESNKYEYTMCPRYIRVMKDAISIEVKRLR